MLSVAGATLRRTRNSFAYRSSGFCKLILAHWLPPRVVSKPAIRITYLTYAGGAYLPMLRESVASLANAWNRLPRLRVVSDGTLEPDRLRSELGFWPSPVEAFDWREFVPEARARGYGSLVRFADRVPMARKMLAVIASAFHGPTMYADVDVLWFRMPRLLSSGGAMDKPRILMSEDFQATYDSNLVPSVLPHLAEPPFYCAGILFANDDFLADCEMSNLFDYAAIHGDSVTEQTLLAEAAHQRGAEVLGSSEFALTDADRFILGPSFLGKPWAARHYIGQVRHLFWRDALALRIGVGSGMSSGR